MNDPALHPLKIKSWSPDDRPREKLLVKGTPSLSDAELLAILLGSGTPAVSAVELARRILHTVNHNLHELARLTTKDLMKIKGIGEAKAVAIIAALELGRRRKEAIVGAKPMIINSIDAYEILRPNLEDANSEEFWIILLNRSNQMIKKCRISQGGVAATVVDAKIIFKLALAELASGIILAHNHPSGSTKISREDKDITKKLVRAGELLDIQILDHLIIAGQDYVSFGDAGLMGPLPA